MGSVASRLVLALVLALLLVVGACAYVQSGDGFRRVVLPLADRFAPGTLSADAGRLGLGGTLEARGLVFEAPELGIRAAAEELSLELSLTSLVFGSRPHVAALRLRDGEIALGPAGSREDAEDRPAEQEDASRPLASLPPLPLSIAQAEVENLRLRLTVADAEEGEPSDPEVAVSELLVRKLRVTDMAAGETGRIELSAEAGVAQEGARYEAELSLEAEIAQTADGVPARWNASLVSDVRKNSLPGVVHFALDLEGENGPGGDDLRAHGRLRAERAGEQVGELRWSLAASDTAVSASLALRSLSELFLNPLIAALGRGQIARAQIDGSLDVRFDLPLDPSMPPREAQGELSVERFDYRTLRVASLHATLEKTPKGLHVEVAPTRVNQGRIQGRLALGAVGEGQQLEAELTATALDLGALCTAFREDIPRRVEGVLDLTASLGASAPAGVDIRETATGQVRARLVHGRVEAFTLMSFLAAQSGVEAFKLIPPDEFAVDAVANIESGVAHVEEATARTSAAALVVNGTIALAGHVDLLLELFVGPRLSGAVERLGVDLPVVATVEKMAAIPAAIRVTGPFADLSYTTVAPRTAERAGDALRAGREGVGKAVRGLKDWLQPKQ